MSHRFRQREYIMRIPHLSGKNIVQSPSCPVDAVALFLSAWLLMTGGCAGPAGRKDTGGSLVDPGSGPARSFVPVGKVVSDLRERIPFLMEKGIIPGLSIALVREGDVVWTEGFGSIRSGSEDPVTGDTVFEACSLSKPVFAYMVMKLVEEGVLDLDKPLVEYTGDSYIEKEFLLEAITDGRIRDITARHILCHTSGFPNWRNGRPITISFAPGEAFSYSGEGYVLLQAVVEKLTGKRLSPLMDEYVFQPLGMMRSSYVWREEYSETAAFPHTSAGLPRGHRVRRRGSAAASLYTTASDFASFMGAVINGRGLLAASINEMLGSQCMLATETPGTMSWGLGFGLQHAGGEESFWHWGDNGEFKCYMLAYKKWKTGVVIFTNSRNGLSVAEELVNLSVGGMNPLFESSMMDKYEDYDSPTFRFIGAALGEGAEAAIANYGSGSDGAGTDLREEGLNALGYRLISEGRMEEAVAVFVFNLELHPESFNVYDSLGEAYMLLGDRERAKEMYLRSIELNDRNWNGKWAVKRLNFVSDDFKAPESIEKSGFRLRRLSGEVAESRYEALTSNRKRIWLQYASERWPAEGMTEEQNLRDLARHSEEFENRYAFAYAVMDPAETRYIGSVYINPSRRDEYDAQVTFWVSAGEDPDSRDEALYHVLKDWLQKEWPFRSIAWPGREISWEEWRRRG